MVPDNKKISQLYNEMLKPLTLFPTQINTGTTEKEDDTYICFLTTDDVLMSKNTPDAMCELIRRRLSRISALNTGSMEVQKIFEEIILSEVKCVCDSIPHVVYTALLTASEKKYLHQRLISHIVIVSEQLFFCYLHKVEWNKMQSVFSDEANLTRLKAQLLLDCSKFLNLFSVTRHLISELKELEGKELIYNDLDDVLKRSFFHSQHINEKRIPLNSYKPHFTMGYFINLGRPDVAVHTVQREADLMQIEKIQHLDFKKVHSYITKQEDNSEHLNKNHCEAVTTPCPYTHSEDKEVEDDSCPDKTTNMKKCTSCPDLRIGDLLSDELHLIVKARASECPESLNTAGSSIFEGNVVEDDLKRLMQASTVPSLHKGKDDVNSDDEIPPLIQAQCHKGSPFKLQKMEALLQDSNTRTVQPEEKKVVKTSPHPQAYSVDVKIPNKPLMRRAEVQASERIFKDLVEIQKYLPVYNDFTSEIEPATVKRLDSNLIVGQDLHEVYGELSMNLQKDYLSFDQDLLTEPFATKVDFSKCVSSSTLNRNKNQRVINTSLDSLALIDKNKSTEQPVTLDKEATRICNSWLVWWKSVVNVDDYIKYLSTQDVDYLKVIYHLYSDESEEEEQVKIALLKKQEEQKRERTKKIADLRAQKQNQIPGMWNVNSILLGGLGTDPVLSDEEHESEKMETPCQMSTNASPDFYQKRINAVWDILHIPHEQQLDMAVKYCSNEYQDLLPEALKKWEKASALIQKREELLAKLEIFEREASDPNRFFQKGYEGTGMARLKESRERAKLHSLLAQMEPKILQVLIVIKKLYNDTVSFQGRPYAEKMQRDKTEMLYWLQQNRRKTLIERDIINSMV
ncbi:coiled-coil domain-containing protein 87 [Bombina bombina]|uniref:coiled-coil domain-containing protein 87 n=1 Tax=Bombina bombina TaxID=8345 RepID=UPI00235B2405|nr:coiled-coil domain-containing protein 87 [Bombina bombina]